MNHEGTKNTKVKRGTAPLLCELGVFVFKIIQHATDENE